MSITLTWRGPVDDVVLEQATRVLAAGGIVACPTETFYALAVDAFQERALQRLMGIKDRPVDKALLVLVADRDMVAKVAETVTPLAEQLMAQILAGAADSHSSGPARPAPAIDRGERHYWSAAIRASSGPATVQALWSSPHRDQRQPLGAGALNQGVPGAAGTGRCH